VGCETTYAFIYRAAPTGRAVMALSTRRHKRRRPSQDIIKDRVVRSDRTRPRKSTTFDFAQHASPRTMRAMTTRFLRCLCLVGQGRGRNRRGRLRRWLPRQIDIDQVSHEESGRGPQPTYSVAASEGFLLRRLHRRPSRAVPMALTLCALGSFVETQAPKPIFPCHQPVP
jgi:hypothetical protein